MWSILYFVISISIQTSGYKEMPCMHDVECGQGDCWVGVCDAGTCVGYITCV